MTPEEEEQVRRALASAPPAAPLPAEVVARLDATLADLVAERSAAGRDPLRDPEPEPAPVVALEERRRRRWPRLLVAAASVSVLAYGVGVAVTGLQVSGGSADSASAGGQAREQAAGGTADSVPKASQDAPNGPVTDDNGLAEHSSRAALADKLLVPRTVRLTSDTLDQDVRRLVRQVSAASPRPSSGDTRSLAGFLASCERPEVARGDRLAAVRLDGRPGTLVLRKASGGARVAEVYSCGDGTRLLALTRVPDVR